MSVRAWHVVVYLDGNDVIAFTQEACGKLYGAGVWIVGSIGRGVSPVGYLSIGQQVATCFRTVDIDHKAIVGCEAER